MSNIFSAPRTYENARVNYYEKFRNGEFSAMALQSEASPANMIRNRNDFTCHRAKYCVFCSRWHATRTTGTVKIYIGCTKRNIFDYDLTISSLHPKRQSEVLVLDTADNLPIIIHHEGLLANCSFNEYYVCQNNKYGN